MRKMPTMAAIFATSDKFPNKVDEFWQPVADGLNLTSESDPRYKLRELLMNAKTEVQGSSQNKGIRIMSSEHIYRCCINAWNKWRKGESVGAKTGIRSTERRYVPV